MNYIKEFQLEYDLVPDGNIGKITAKKLQEVLEIPSMVSVCYLLGQIKVESTNFTAGRENLYYSKPETLMKVFPSKFKTIQSAIPFTKNPSKLANYVYANRMGNGDGVSNDGWNNRGVGGIQLTGKDNIEAYLKSVHLALNTDRRVLESPVHFFNTGCFFFTMNSLWKFTLVPSESNIRKLSRGVNLGNPLSNKPALHEHLRLTYTLTYFQNLL